MDRNKIRSGAKFKMAAIANICFAADVEGFAKRSVTNRLSQFYPRYILKCSLHLNGVLSS